MNQQNQNISQSQLNRILSEEELRALFNNKVLVKMSDESILNNNSIREYVNNNHLIIFIESTGQIYIDGIYYGSSVSEEIVRQLVEDYINNNIQEILNNSITTLVEKNDQHIEVKLVETEKEDDITHNISYITPYKYDITLKDVASDLEYQKTKTTLSDLVSYTYYTTEINEGIPVTVQHDGTITYIHEYLVNTIIGNNPDESYNTIEKIANWIKDFNPGYINLSELTERVDRHDAFLDIRDTIIDQETQESRPIRLSELVTERTTYVLGPLKDPEFIVTQIEVDGEPTIPEDKINNEGIVPYKTLTEVNVAIKKLSDRIAEGEEPAEANKINEIQADNIWISAYTNSSYKLTTIEFKEEKFNKELDKRLCWNEVIQLPESDNG